MLMLMLLVMVMLELIMLVMLTVLVMVMLILMMLVMLMLIRRIFSVKHSFLYLEVGEVVSVENFPAEGETCRDASHPHQTVVKGRFETLKYIHCISKHGFA